MEITRTKWISWKKNNKTDNKKYRNHVCKTQHAGPIGPAHAIWSTQLANASC